MEPIVTNLRFCTDEELENELKRRKALTIEITVDRLKLYAGDSVQNHYPSNYDYRTLILDFDGCKFALGEQNLILLKELIEGILLR